MFLLSNTERNLRIKGCCHQRNSCQGVAMVITFWPCKKNTHRRRVREEGETATITTTATKATAATTWTMATMVTTATATNTHLKLCPAILKRNRQTKMMLAPTYHIVGDHHRRSFVHGCGCLRQVSIVKDESIYSVHVRACTNFPVPFCYRVLLDIFRTFATHTNNMESAHYLQNISWREIKRATHDL